MRTQGKYLVLSVALSTLYLGGLTLAPLFLGALEFDALMSEEGPFETASWCLWLVLAVACAVQTPRLGWRALGFSAIALAFSARELGWQRALTGGNIFKFNYYAEAPAPIAEKFIAGTIALLLLGLTLWALIVGLRIAISEKPRKPYTLTVTFTAALLVTTKLLDRFPAQYRKLTGGELSHRIDNLLLSYEEGLEMILPLLFLLAILQWRQSGTTARWTPPA